MSLSPAQLAIRKTRISATDAPVILGLSPWRSPADLLAQKLYDVEPEAETEAQAIGNMCEPGLVRWCADTLGVTPRVNVGTLIHPKHDWLCATPDAAIVERSAEGIEGKTAGIMRGEYYRSDEWGEPDSAEVPAAYWVQVQIQMQCTGWEAVWLAALIAGRGRVRYRILRDDARVARIIDRCGQWHADHVIDRKPLPPGQVPSLDVLAAIRRRTKSLALAGVCEPLILEWERVNADKLAAEKREKDARAAMLHSLGDADGCELSDGRTFTYYEYQRTGYTVAPGSYRRVHLPKPKPRKGDE